MVRERRRRGGGKRKTERRERLSLRLTGPGAGRWPSWYHAGTLTAPLSVGYESLGLHPKYTMVSASVHPFIHFVSFLRFYLPGKYMARCRRDLRGRRASHGSSPFFSFLRSLTRLASATLPHERLAAPSCLPLSPRDKFSSPLSSPRALWDSSRMDPAIGPSGVSQRRATSRFMEFRADAIPLRVPFAV